MTDTREKLLAAATNLFLGKGYGVVGTAELCKSAGINKGTFYHYFPSKVELLIAAIDHYAEQFRSAFMRISASKDAPEDKLTALFEVPAKANREWQKTHGFAQGCLVGNMTLELGSVEEPVRDAVREAMKSWRFAIEPIIVELMEFGDIPAVDPGQGAELLIAMIQGGLVLAKAQNDPSRVTALAPGAIGALSSLAASLNH